jgi:serine/threonine-protein kinase
VVDPALPFLSDGDETIVGGKAASAEAVERPLEGGTRIGVYEVVELIGRGGMGFVYLAEHSKLGRRVALKVLRGELARDKDTVRRFFGEARAVNQIRHENIIEVTDFLEPDDGRSCYVMELLEGCNASQLLKQEGTLDPVRAIRICAQVASAVAAVHRADIVHRDLKSENIFLIERSGKRDFVKLLDFGVAKLSSSEGGGGDGIVGTPAYMSPEQLEGSSVDSRADIYALGVILYEMVSGTRPLEGGTAGELLLKHTTDDVVPLRERNEAGARASEGLEELVQRCLAKDPAERPMTMAEVEQELLALIPRDELPAPPTAPAPAPSSRLPWLAAAALAIVGVVAGVTLLPGEEAVGTPAETPVVAAPPPTPAPAPAPEKIRLGFVSEPVGAMVFREGQSEPLGVTPFVADFEKADESARFRFELSDHLDIVEEVRLDASGKVRATLKREVAAVRPKPKKPPPAQPPPKEPKPRKRPEGPARTIILDPFADG